MASYHCSVKVLSRSAGRSSVQFAAYIAGEKLKDERLGQTFNHTSKEEVCCGGFVFDERVPEQIRTPQKFWNAVEDFEKSEKAQVCRTWEIALPKELSTEQNISWIQDYVKELIKKDGMPAVQYAIHDKEGNPHAHIMAPTRDIDKDGQFMIKTKKDYVLGEDGQRLPVLDQSKIEQYEQNHGHAFSMDELNGLKGAEREQLLAEVQKVRERKGKGQEKLWQRQTVEFNPWNSKAILNEWRERAATMQNRALEIAGKEERVDHRSYEEQGIERIPMIHEGYQARLMGEESERVQLNNQIREINREFEQQMTMLQQLQNTWDEFLRSMEHVRDYIRERINRIGREAIGRGTGADIAGTRTETSNDIRLEIERRRSIVRESGADRASRDAERERQRIEASKMAERAERARSRCLERERDDFSL